MIHKFRRLSIEVRMSTAERRGEVVGSLVMKWWKVVIIQPTIATADRHRSTVHISTIIAEGATIRYLQ